MSNPNSGQEPNQPPANFWDWVNDMDRSRGSQSRRRHPNQGFPNFMGVPPMGFNPFVPSIAPWGGVVPRDSEETPRQTNNEAEDSQTHEHPAPPTVPDESEDSRFPSGPWPFYPRPGEERSGGPHGGQHSHPHGPPHHGPPHHGPPHHGPPHHGPPHHGPPHHGPPHHGPPHHGPPDSPPGPEGPPPPPHHRHRGGHGRGGFRGGARGGGRFSGFATHPTNGAYNGNWPQFFNSQDGQPPFDLGALADMLAQQFGYVRDENAAKESKKDEGNTDKDFTPAADIFDTKEAFVVHISLPGAKREDVGCNWNADESELAVAGVIYRPGDEEVLKTLALNERQVGLFERKIKLGSREKPASVDSDGISAKMEDGVLIVKVPKVLEEEFVEVKKVDIQ